MENMQIKNLLLIVLFMSAQLFGGDRVEDLFGVDSATINKGLVTVLACGILLYAGNNIRKTYAGNSIRQANQNRAVVTKEIVLSEVGPGVLANVNGANRGEKKAEGEEPIDSTLSETGGLIRANSVNSGSLFDEVAAGNEKSDEEEAVVALSSNILENLLCEVMCEIVDNNLNVNFGSSESLEARYNVMRDRYSPNQTKDFSAWSCEMLEKITDINTEWNREMELSGRRRQGKSLENLTQLQKNSILGCLLYNRWREPVGLRLVERAVACVMEGTGYDYCGCRPVDQSETLFYDCCDDSWQKETGRLKGVLCGEYVRSASYGYMPQLTTEEENFYTTYPDKALVACILKPLELSEKQKKYVVVSLSRIPGLTMGDFAKTVEDYCANSDVSSEDDQDSV